MKILKKLIAIVCILFLLPGCAENDDVQSKSVIQQLEQQYNAIMSAKDSSEMRACLNEINSISNLSSATDDEKKFAKTVLYLCSGIAKLSMTDKGIRAFEFLEVSYLQPIVEGTFESGEFTDLDEALQMSEKFLNHVNEFIK